MYFRRLFLVISFALLTTFTLYSAPLGIMVPAYFDPSSDAKDWNSLDNAASRVPLTVIMNPDSGPGASRDSAYVQALSRLHQAGGKVTGYVHTSYGTRSLTDVEADIDAYLSFYAVDGFFIDEMTDDENTNHLAYYAALYQYIKAKGTNYSVTGNPGSNTQASYLAQPVVDCLMIFEDDGTNYPGFLPSDWVTAYSARQFVHLPYDVPDTATMSNDVALAAIHNAGWIYLTDLTLPNPYDALPSYWTNEVNLVSTITSVFPNPSIYKKITVDGSFDDWTGVPLAYTAPEGSADAIQYENVYLANDQSNLYIQFTLYSPRADAFANPYDNIFIGSGDSSDPGYSVAGVNSDMLIQWGSGFQEKDGGFNEGAINNLGWQIAGSPDSTDFELSISRNATYASDGTLVFTNNTIEVLLEGDDTSYNNTAFAPPSGGLIYTFANAMPGPLTISDPGGNAVISWPGAGTLQSCGSLANGGAWTNVPDANSPYNIKLSDVQIFFRLAQPLPY